jgi:hypothetical protein
MSDVHSTPPAPSGKPEKPRPDFPSCPALRSVAWNNTPRRSSSAYDRRIRIVETSGWSLAVVTAPLILQWDSTTG